MNNYEVPEVVEIGRAQDLILGSSKIDGFIPDGPDQPPRQTVMEEDE
ncbi:MAG TPA: hypothetical protein VJ875_19520 [Pyrinomonadaceae bacterium]|jgi:hypothetical protein|nr:hypothetical protein [Pyrinomonadaceae bacterium]